MSRPAAPSSARVLPARLLPALVLVGSVLVATGASPGASTAAVPLRCGGKVVTVPGSGGTDDLVGTNGDDVIAARGGNDTVRGLGGDDVICGGSGTDVLRGGGGRDRLLGGTDLFTSTDEGTEIIGDRLVGGPGDDVLSPGRDGREADERTPDLVSWSGATGGVHADLAARRARGPGVGSDRVVGPARFAVRTGDFRDVVVGGPDDDEVYAGAGSDVLRGAGGDDHLLADDFGTGGADRARGGPGDDWIEAYDGDDVLRGDGGSDIVSDRGATSLDRLYGGPGPDRLVDDLGRGASDDQALAGGAGSDSLLLSTFGINPGFDPATGDVHLAGPVLTWTDATGTVTAAVSGLEGLDLSTEGTSWEITGDDSAESVYAGGSDGTAFHAAGGRDRFSGSSGDDWFDAGDGTDTLLFIGEGADRCDSVDVFDPPETEDDCETVLP